jgi:hypothetical protein
VPDISCTPPGSELFDADLWGDLGLRALSHPRTDAARERNLSWLRGHGFFGSCYEYVLDDRASHHPCGRV